MTHRVEIGATRWVLFAPGVSAFFGALALVAAPAATATPLPTNCEQAGPLVTCTYAFTGDEQLFTVPDGVRDVTVTATGASGGNDSSGAGAIAKASLVVTPNSTLYVEVGGRGAVGGSAGGKGGFNGGGDGGSYHTVSDAPGGGGASDVRTVPRAHGEASLASRLIVAGGGGGAGNGGKGGNAGSEGEGTARGAGGGRAGSATTSGAGGVPDSEGGNAGSVGALGDGGSGGTGDGGGRLCACGGGGGGGVFGGGGGSGGFNPAWTPDGAGGGGGSSLANGGTITLAAPGDSASVVISYTPAG